MIIYFNYDVKTYPNPEDVIDFDDIESSVGAALVTVLVRSRAGEKMPHEEMPYEKHCRMRRHYVRLYRVRNTRV